LSIDKTGELLVVLLEAYYFAFHIYPRCCEKHFLPMVMNSQY